MGRDRIDYTHCTDCNIEYNTMNILYSRDRPRSRCKECYNKHECKRRALDPAASRNSQLKYRFGISLEDYNGLLNLQGGACAICKQSCPTGKDLGVDHNHLTGEVRGLLCQTCNQAIGFLREDPNMIMNAYDYLNRTTWNKGLELVRIREKKA